MNAVRPPLGPAELIIQAESELLDAVARLLGRGSVASADWKVDRLRRMGALSEESIKIITRYRDAVFSGSDAQIEQASFDQLRETDGTFLTAAGDGALFKGVLPFDADPAIETVIQSWQTQARAGLSMAMTSLVQNAGQVYVDTVNRTSLQVVAGGMTIREALATTVKEWAAAGIPSITDKAGRQWSTEAYVAMVLKSTSARVTADVSLTRATEYGTDLIEVSAHAGARPGCAPYQGRVFSISGTSEKYPALSSTSYGEPAGLFGINCGHRPYPFFEGLSRRTYEPTKDMAENDRIYKQSQVQRSLERSIRAAKREASMLDAVGDTKGAAAARGQVRDRQAALRRFIADTGRTRRPDREQIHDGGAGPSASVPAGPQPFTPAPTRQAAGQWARENLGVRLADYGKSDLSVINAWNQGAYDALTKFPALRDGFKDIGTNQALRRAYIERFTAQALGDPNLMARLSKVSPERRVEMIRKEAARQAGKSPPNNWAYSYKDPFRRGVSINEKYAANPELLMAGLRQSVRSGFHPIGCDTVKSIIDHEMAHQVDGLLGWISRTRAFAELLRGHNVARELSEYATKNPMETLAEAWAEFRNNPKPRPLASKIGLFLETEYARRYGGTQ